MHGSRGNSRPNYERYKDCFRLWSKLNIAGLRNKEKFLSVFKDTLTQFEQLKTIEAVLSKQTVELHHLIILLFPNPVESIGSQAEYFERVQKFDQTLEKFFEMEAISKPDAFDSINSQMFIEVQEVIGNAEKKFFQQIADVIDWGPNLNRSEDPKIDAIDSEMRYIEKFLNRYVFPIDEFIENTEQKEDLLKRVENLKKKLCLCANVLKNRTTRIFRHQFPIYIKMMRDDQFEKLQQNLRKTFEECRKLEAEFFPPESTRNLKNQIFTSQISESEERGEGSLMMSGLFNRTLEESHLLNADHSHERLQINSSFVFENQIHHFSSNLMKPDKHSGELPEESNARVAHADHNSHISSMPPEEIKESNGEIEVAGKKEMTKVLNQKSLNRERSSRVADNTAANSQIGTPNNECFLRKNQFDPNDMMLLSSDVNCGFVKGQNHGNNKPLSSGVSNLDDSTDPCNSSLISRNNIKHITSIYLPESEIKSLNLP